MPVAIICPSPHTYARQRPITTTASHSSLYDMLAISSRYQYGPFLFFVVAEVTSNYLTTDGLKKLSLLPEAPLRPEARGICHICHMVNPALMASVRFGTSLCERKNFGLFGVKLAVFCAAESKWFRMKRKRKKHV